MSSTLRGTIRKECDFYATPIDVVQKLLDTGVMVNVLNVLEPSAGNGNICYTIRRETQNVRFDAVELREEERAPLSKLCNNVYIHDFLTFDVDKEYDLIIGNPPFALAMEFVEKSLEIVKAQGHGRVAMLLRTAFLESVKRKQFWNDNPPSGVYVLAQRPSFTTDGKRDSCSFSWFVWEIGSTEQTIQVI